MIQNFSKNSISFTEFEIFRFFQSSLYCPYTHISSRLIAEKLCGTFHCYIVVLSIGIKAFNCVKKNVQNTLLSNRFFYSAFHVFAQTRSRSQKMEFPREKITNLQFTFSSEIVSSFEVFRSDLEQT